jgi:hypothetical protein
MIDSGGGGIGESATGDVVVFRRKAVIQMILSGSEFRVCPPALVRAKGTGRTRRNYSFRVRRTRTTSPRPAGGAVTDSQLIGHGTHRHRRPRAGGAVFGSIQTSTCHLQKHRRPAIFLVCQDIENKTLCLQRFAERNYGGQASERTQASSEGGLPSWRPGRACSRWRRRRRGHRLTAQVTSARPG